MEPHGGQGRVVPGHRPGAGRPRPGVWAGSRHDSTRPPLVRAELSGPPQQPDAPGLDLRVRERRAGSVVVEVGGELTAGAMAHVVRSFVERQWRDPDVGHVRLDLAPLAHIDLEGVSTLVALLREGRERGKTLTVERPRGPVRDRLSVTGTLHLLTASHPRRAC